MGLLSIIRILLSIYMYLILARMLATWIQGAEKYRVMQWLMKISDPYLNMFRGWMPLLGKSIDIGPAVAFLVLYWFTHILKLF